MKEFFNEGWCIDIDNERILIPIYFNEKIDIEGIQDAFNEVIKVLIQDEKRILKQIR